MASLKELSEYLVYHIIKAPFSILPRKAALLAGRTIGFLFYLLDRRHRRIALSNLKTAFGAEHSSSELKRIARNSFQHFGEVFMETIKFPRIQGEKKKALFNVEGEDNLLKALHEGRGVLLFTGHFGNWEVGPFYLSRLEKVHVVARSLDNRLLEKEFHQFRISLGADVIYKHQATRKILQSLRAKEIVAFLIDQNVLRSQAVFVDFFGRKAATTPSLAAFFLRTKSPLVPAFCYPTSSHGYIIKIFKPLKIIPSGNYSQDVLKITQICTKIIEDQIRKHPDYWLWFHNRWKTRPEEEKEG